jgi:predicted RNase H-like HicB family nuclease
MRFAVVIEKDRDRLFCLHTRSSGCVSLGGTREELGRNIREAIDLYLDELRVQGLPLPTPVTETETVLV